VKKLGDKDKLEPFWRREKGLLLLGRGMAGFKLVVSSFPSFHSFGRLGVFFN
jgi:hypothetical protein